jgi:hypothetical protein
MGASVSLIELADTTVSTVGRWTLGWCICLIAVAGIPLPAQTRDACCGQHSPVAAANATCVDLPETGQDSAVRSAFRFLQKPPELARSFFRVSLRQASSNVAVILAPNELVTHSRLFALIVGRRFCYFGSRQTAFGAYDAATAQSQWNEVLATLQVESLVGGATDARSLGALVLAFLTGEPLAPRRGILEHELVAIEEPCGLKLPKPDALEGPTIVHRVGDDWKVSGTWHRWIFKMTFSAKGIVRDLTLQPIE